MIVFESITESEEKIYAQIEKLEKEIKRLKDTLEDARASDAKKFMTKYPVIMEQILYDDHDRYLYVKVGSNWRMYTAFKVKNKKFHVYDIDDCATVDEKYVVSSLVNSNPSGDTVVCYGFTVSSIDNFQSLKASKVNINTKKHKPCKKSPRKTIKRK